MRFYRRAAARLSSFLYQHRLQFTTTQILVASFLAVLLPCALLLMHPWFSTKPISFTDALFTASSAITVTGLGVLDTGGDFTKLGQCVLLFLMEVGGIGQMTFTTVLLVLLGVRMSLKQRILTQAQFSVEAQTNVGVLAQSILGFALISQAIGVVILSFVFMPEFGFSEGLFIAIFHSISAFNNAGFSVFSTSLIAYQSNPTIIITIALLIIVGGIGFTVVRELWELRTRPCRENNFSLFRFAKLSLHSKLMLVGTLFLIVAGMCGIFVLELVGSPEFAAKSTSDQWLLAFFQSVTSRTAGFASTDISAMRPASIFIIILLMFIGAGSASVAGGLKITTVLVALAASLSFLRKRDSVTLFRQSVNWSMVNRALTMMVASVLLITAAIFLLLVTENATFDMIVFEVVSAFSTVGLSIGLSERLSEFGKWVIIFIMIVGRIGPITLFFLLTHPNRAPYKYAEGQVMVG